MRLRLNSSASACAVHYNVFKAALEINELAPNTHESSGCCGSRGMGNARLHSVLRQPETKLARLETVETSVDSDTDVAADMPVNSTSPSPSIRTLTSACTTLAVVRGR